MTDVKLSAIYIMACKRVKCFFVWGILFALAHGVTLALVTAMLTLPSGEEEAILRMFS